MKDSTRSTQVCMVFSPDAALLREDLADLLPLVEQANAISQELDKKVRQVSDRTVTCPRLKSVHPIAHISAVRLV